ncbi:hypothetical protein BDV37DRAFT_249571 [Aspergillus pseudonomiae]|uniref:F-box domain-containing protein n=1 Tax=Aspergillus pseudonomiae TaxID=1506151 RepID=A0A5N7DB31_9EURO|nr:uncharacterized protein BDV37DRAFT_249571 [Aspergillus pseudonomiae]KAE8403670.1 hypothetical protein BDV37DRAFT_249571 [Aspergillus pseudonomiae]
MPSLLDLPLELLIQIVQETTPVDFEATALSCKALFAASAPFRAQYATRRKRFQNFKFSTKVDENLEGAEEPDLGDRWDKITQETGIKIVTTRELLEQIALDPSVAQYIHSINLREHGDNEDDEEVINSLETEVPRALRDLVFTSPFIEAVEGNPDDWIGGIRESIIDADLFLLTLLPQVREIALHPRWDEVCPGNERLWSVLSLITYRANHQKEFPDTPLSMLSIVQPSQDMGYEEKLQLTSFVPFLTIKSVSEVNLGSCVFKDDGYTGYAFDPLVECYSANLRKLSIESSVAGVEELSQLLSRIPNLEIFEFSHETKWHGCGYNWNVGAFLDTVQDVCGKTLKELSVSNLTKWCNRGSTLVDMTRFQVLAVLELGVDMLCGPAYDPSMRALEWDETEWHGNPAWPKLIDMLPASIEKFNLYLETFDDDHLKCISHLIEGLSDARATKLPHLNDLSLFVYVDSPKVPDMALEVLNAAKTSGFSILNFTTSDPLL